jgi:hypothetical protein
MPEANTNQSKPKPTRRRADTLLFFDPAKEAPEVVLRAIVDEWLVPSLVEQFLRERGITQQSLLSRYRTLE